MELSYKHKQVVEHYVANGMQSRTKSYQAIYTNANDATASVNSSRLFAHKRTKEYLEQVLKENMANLVVSKEELVSNLQFIINANKATNPMAAIKAIETLAKMNGYMAPVKSETDLTVHGEQPLFSDEDLKPRLLTEEDF